MSRARLLGLDAHLVFFDVAAPLLFNARTYEFVRCRRTFIKRKKKRTLCTKIIYKKKKN